MKEIKKVDAWATFLKSYNRLHQGMEEEMKRLGHPDLEIYDILWTLEKAPEGRLRYKDLGKKVYLSRYNISRLIERLEKQQLIMRKSCQVDKRGVFAEITSAGKLLRARMWRDYSELIKNIFSSKLTAKDHEQLVMILKKVWQEED
jgi:DNA-binding MarR family transcriptional regulator